MHSHIGHIYLTFLHCAFSNVSSNCLPEMMQNHIGCICLTFSTVRFQMCPQIACQKWCKITLVAFVWLFSTVRLKMFLRRCKVTLHPLTKCLFRRLSSPLFSGLSFHKTKSCYLRPNISDRFPSHFIHIQIFVSKKTCFRETP